MVIPISFVPTCKIHSSYQIFHLPYCNRQPVFGCITFYLSIKTGKRQHYFISLYIKITNVFLAALSKYKIGSICSTHILRSPHWLSSRSYCLTNGAQFNFYGCRRRFLNLRNSFFRITPRIRDWRRNSIEIWSSCGTRI